MSMYNYNLFLDDFRLPQDAFHYTKDTVFSLLDWEIVRSHEEFVNFIERNYSEGKFPSLVAFDHDLDDAHYEHTSGEIPYEEMAEKTGMHSAKWLVEFCIEKKLKLPDYRVHSMNPSGRANIEGLLANFKKFQEKED
jgi:hypothetical protein